MSMRSKTKSDNEKATGISEIVTDSDLLLDDFILEQKEYDAHIKKQQGTASLKEKELNKAGEEIQTQAVQRMSSGAGPSNARKKGKRKTLLPLMSGALL